MRALAALLVFLYHFPPRIEVGALAALWSEGHVGVTVFFVLSGYLITSRYSPRFARGELALSEYFVKRVARIVPLYWTVLALSLRFGQGEWDWSATWPEWTLTMAFFSRSVHDLAVPTAWSLTLEECFYALAPLLFVLIAATSRRLVGRGHEVGPAQAAAAAVVLGTTVVALAAAGVVVARACAGSALGFLSTPYEVALHTIFGRFADFAIGCGFGLAAGGPALTRFRERPRAAATTAALSAATILAAQVGLRAIGPPEVVWAQAWVLNFVIALASGGLIVALTSPRSVVSRALSAAPLVYLGRVSFALYLVQSTPFAHGLMHNLLPSTLPLNLLALYAGLTALSALLHELVEEPARRGLLTLWERSRGRPPREVEPARGWSTLARSAGAVVAALAVAAQAGAWHATERGLLLGPHSLAEVRHALDADSEAMIQTPLAQARIPRPPREGVSASRAHVPLPDHWMRGRPGAERAPGALLVYLDEAPIPFSRLGAGSRTGAYFGAPRSRALSLNLPADATGELTLVRATPLVSARLQARRALAAPAGGLLLFTTFAVTAALASWTLRRTSASPARLAAAAVAALGLGLGLELHATDWMLPTIGIEWTALAVLGVLPTVQVSGSASTRSRPDDLAR